MINAAQARPRRRGVACGVRLGRWALWCCVALGSAPADAGRTDSDWMAAPQRTLRIEAPGDLESLDAGQPAPSATGGPGAAQVAIVADMRIATHEEARALLQGSRLPGGADLGASNAGGATATLSALLASLSASLPSSAGDARQRPDATVADLDCALFTESVKVRRLLGARDVHKPGESAGPSSAMWLDVPIRCLANVTRAAPPARGRKALQPASDLGMDAAGLPLWRRIEAWVRPGHNGWTALAASSVALVLFGLVARSRSRAHTKASTRIWR